MDDKLKKKTEDDPEVIRRREMFKKLRQDIKEDDKAEKEANY